MTRNLFKICICLACGWAAGMTLMAAPVDWVAVQRNLKAQGLYFGEIDGSSGSETMAAVNRFQIRQGLPVTGEFDEATQAALAASSKPGAAAEGARPEPQLSTWYEPAVAEESAGVRDLDALFADTGLAASSNARKRAALREVQTRMQKAGTYSGQIDGDPGPKTHQGLLDYQARFGLTQTAAADLETLKSMGLEVSTLGADADRRAASRRRGSRERKPDIFKRTGRTVGKFFRQVF